MYIHTHTRVIIYTEQQIASVLIKIQDYEPGCIKVEGNQLQGSTRSTPRLLTLAFEVEKKPNRRGFARLCVVFSVVAQKTATDVFSSLRFSTAPRSLAQN